MQRAFRGDLVAQLGRSSEKRSGRVRVAERPEILGSLTRSHSNWSLELEFLLSLYTKRLRQGKGGLGTVLYWNEVTGMGTGLSCPPTSNSGYQRVMGGQGESVRCQGG